MPGDTFCSVVPYRPDRRHEAPGELAGRHTKPRNRRGERERGKERGQNIFHVKC